MGRAFHATKDRFNATHDCVRRRSANPVPAMELRQNREFSNKRRMKRHRAFTSIGAFFAARNQPNRAAARLDRCFRTANLAAAVHLRIDGAEERDEPVVLERFVNRWVAWKASV
jgi:hypothetical protein